MNYQKFNIEPIYRARAQDVAQEMERNQAAAKQSQVRPSTQLLLSYLHFFCDILISGKYL